MLQLSPTKAEPDGKHQNLPKTRRTQLTKLDH
jgi:hypothetical protein